METEGPHSSAVREVNPDESVAPAKNTLWTATLWFGSLEGIEETLQSLMRELQDLVEKKN